METQSMGVIDEHKDRRIDEECGRPKVGTCSVRTVG
jgi:hypothetical protein